MRVHQQGSREKGSEEEDLATEGPSERADAESLKADERESVAALTRSSAATLSFHWAFCRLSTARCTSLPGPESNV